MDGPIHEERATKAAPYTSFSTLKTFAADLHEHGMPARIDTSVLTNFNGSVRRQLLTSLRFLDLIDGSGKPTAKLEALATAYGTEAWPTALRNILTTAYTPIFAIDLANATPSLFSETFSNAYPGTEAVLRKCKGFFLPAAKEAGIAISSRILAGKKPRDTAVTSRRRVHIQRRVGAEPTPPPPPPAETTTALTPPTAFQLTALLDPNMTAEEQKAVWTLIQYTRKKEAEKE